MTPLHVVAHLAGPVCLPTRHLALDGLLAWAIAARDGLAPPAVASDCKPIEIPIAREPDGRFHLCSHGCCEVEGYEHRWLNRRFPLTEAQEMGCPKLRRVLLKGGPCKSYRLPLETLWMVDDRVEWWCLGDSDAIAKLLDEVGYIGKKRATGLGKVASWAVEPCAPWGDGFPVVRDGAPLRPLPLDWPGLVEPAQAFQCLSYPYWDHTAEELCAVPR